MSKASRGGAEKTAVHAARALAEMSVDDESWRAFLFAVFPDPQSNIDGEQMTSLMNSFHEQVGSGIRQKFSVISAQEIVQWACDNSKLYDVCKEVKCAVDGGTDPLDLPEPLLACLVKYRMLALKQIALDAKSSSPMGDEEMAMTPHSDDGAKKKDAVKEKEKESKVDREKEREKSPKRGGKASNSKSAEQGSRRQSLQPTEELPSRHKVKLRDKILAKAPDKPLVIGDEPVPGPDAYYLLHGFSSAGIFKALIEHANVPINAIINVQIGGERSKEQTKSTKTDSPIIEGVGKQENLMDTIKAYIQNADGTSLWKQIACCDVTAVNLKDGRELFDLVSKRAYHVVEKRLAYDAYYDQCVQITLPDIEKEPLNRHDRRFYNRFLDSLGNTTPISVETIVHAMLEDVSHAMSDGEGPDTTGVNFGEEKNTLSGYFDRAVEKLAFADSNAVLNPTDPNLPPDQGTPDVGYNRKKSADLTNNDVKKTMLSQMPMARYQSIVSKIPRLKNEDSVMRERAFLKQNLLQSTGLSEYMIDRVLLQQMFGQLVEEENGSSTVNMEGWNSVEYFGKEELTETLQNARLSLPIIRTRYLARERLLLLAMFSSSSNTDLVTTSSSEFQVATKPSFNLYLKLANENKAPVFPSTPSPLFPGPRVYASGDEMIHQVDNCTHLYPSDGSQIQIHNVKFAHSGDDAYTKILHRDAIVVWGSEGISKYGTYISYSLPEGNVFSMSRNEKSLVDVKVSTSNGLLLSWSEDNHVVQSYPSPAENQEHGMSDEIRRKISPKGTVIRFLRDRSTHLLYPNGNVSIIAEDGSCTSTDQTGRRLGTDSAGREFTVAPVRLVKETHPGVNETSVTTREDMVMITAMKDGTTIVEHADGTKITTSEAKVSVECMGFAKVEFWKEDKKSVVNLSKSVTVEQSCAVGVAKYKFAKVYGPLLQVNGNGKAIFFPSLCAQTQLQYGKDETSIKGAYYIDFANNNLRLIDGEKHTFAVERGSIKVEIEDAGVDEDDSPDIQFETAELKSIWASMAKTTSLRGGSPRLFAIREDGTGLEYLHDSTLAQVLLSHASNSKKEVVLETVLEEKALTIFAITKADTNDEQSKLACVKHEAKGTHQKIIHHCKITARMHDLVKKGLSDFADSQRGIEIPNQQIMAKGRDETGNASSHDLKSRLALLIPSPASTPVSEDIVELAPKLPETSTGRLGAGIELESTSTTTFPDTSNPDPLLSSAIEISPAKLKPIKQASSAEVNQTGKFVKPPRTKDFNAIPKYFDSFEGQLFLRTLPKETICSKRRPSSKKKPAMVVEQPFASLPEQIMSETPSNNDGAKPSQVEEEVKDDTTKVEAPNLPQMETHPTSPEVEAVPSAQANEMSKVASHDLVQAMQIRRSKVPKPFSLRGTKPGVIPNERFIKIDGAVRRKVTTASTARMVLGNNQDFGKSVGFTTIPALCNFGTVYAGNTYQTAFSMTNIGNDTARFKLKLLGTGSGNENLLQFSYRPGPVAAGMKVKVNVRLITSGNNEQARSINEVLQIISESEILNVPIKAVVLNSDDFEDAGVSIKSNIQVV